MSIFLLSDNIRSGKTSRLWNWAKGQPKVGGFLTPDVEGKRFLLELSTGRFYPFEVKQPTPHTISIGKFHFLQTAFDLGRNILKRDREQALPWLIIDEIGPLELKGLGFEPEVRNTIAHYQALQTEGHLVLVVRKKIVAQVLAHFQISDAQPFKFS